MADTPLTYDQLIAPDSTYTIIRYVLLSGLAELTADRWLQSTSVSGTRLLVSGHAFGKGRMKVFRRPRVARTRMQKLARYLLACAWAAYRGMVVGLALAAARLLVWRTCRTACSR